MPKVGVLALQGAVREHIQMLEAIGCEAVAVKTVEDLQQIDGLILPGGESTTMRKLLDRYALFEPIRLLAKQGLPMYGTCAGLILLARELVGYEPHLAVMDILVERNSYGRQTDSFETNLSVKHIGENIPAVFIRAPHIVSVNGEVEVLATHENKIVFVRDGQFLGCSFHPELTGDTRIMQYFVKIIQEQ